MCEKLITGLMSSVGLATPKDGGTAAVVGGDTAREADAKVKLDDGATVYDRTSGGGRVSGGGRKKSKTSNVPGLGL